MATNRHDTLDPALLRPGRLDRKIEFPIPDRRQKRLIFSTVTNKMNLSEEVDLEDCILRTNYKFLFLLTDLKIVRQCRCSSGLMNWKDTVLNVWFP
jgi:SpoVK/Ycf46/Vps4 family AAA+-type ATPase